MNKRTLIYIVASIFLCVLNIVAGKSLLNEDTNAVQMPEHSEVCSFILQDTEETNKIIVSKEATMAQSVEGGICFPTQSFRTQFRRNNLNRGGNSIAWVNDITGHINLSAHFFLTQKVLLHGLCETDKSLIKLEKLII